MRHALITGGGTGIGRAVALRLVDEGWAVTVVGRRPEPLAEVEALRAGRVGAEVADVTEPSELSAAFAAAAHRFGPVEAVIANAGVATSAPFTQVRLEDWRRMLDVNLTGAFLTAQVALPAMLERKHGRVVFIASTAGLEGYAYVAPYCAAKHGVVGLARALAVEVARQGITVNAVCPGYVETEMLANTIANITATTGRSEAEARAALLRGNPLGRFVTPEEVAASVAYLLSEGAASVTGQALAISGGEVGSG